jgi:ribosomal protein S21
MKAKSSSPKLTMAKPINGAAVPSSKTCNWVFENGQVCGKTFSKSYNLVVHMRMHEDIRPFACTLCDQTFRQKAHLQRHETTHGIQTKNFYRTPSSKKKKKRASSPKLSKSLQDRLTRVNHNLGKNGVGEDSEGEEYMEDDEDDIYVPNGNPAKRMPVMTRKYSDSDKDQANGLDTEMDSEGVVSTTPANHLDPSDVRDQLQAKQERALCRKLVSRQEDADTSTVQDILQTVNSVPTLEKLESTPFLNCDSLLLRALPSSRPIMSTGSNTTAFPVTSTTFNHPNTSLPHITKLVESTSISSSPACSASSTLPVSLFNNNPSAQTNILFTTLSSPCLTSPVSSSHKSLSFIETSVPAVSSVSASSSFNGNSVSKNQQLVIDNIDDHSPEIQAEILNALLADETYGDTSSDQEIWEEEIFRLTTLPSAWWVSRRRKAGSQLGDLSYYSPQGYCFKTRQEIQEFLQNHALPKDLRTSELRSPPLPIEQIPIIEESYIQRVASPVHSLDTNSIAQALIANLKPEPIESLKEALNSEPKLRDSLSLGHPPPSLTLSSVS